MGSSMVRVDRGDGRLLQFREGDVNKFLADNPDARVVPGRSGELRVTPQEVAATEALKEGPPNFAAMRKPQIEAYAEEHEIDISEASNNEERVTLIAAAGESD